MDQIQKTLLEEIADLHEVPAGAYNIRVNGAMAGRHTTANIDIKVYINPNNNTMFLLLNFVLFFCFILTPL